MTDRQTDMGNPIDAITYKNFWYIFFCNYRFRIPNVTEKLKRDSEKRTLSSNLIFTIWAVFGGFILHFLLCNFLKVLLTPSYEEPVETAKDLIKRNIIPFYMPYGEMMRQFFEASSDPTYKEISRRLVIPKDWDDFSDMVRKVTSTGMYANIGAFPPVPEEEYNDWYMSTETIAGTNPYGVHLSNKKWPLKKVLLAVICLTIFDSFLSEV